MTSARRKAAARAGHPDVPVPRWQAPSVASPVERDGSTLAATTHRAEPAPGARHAEVNRILKAGGPSIVYQPQLSLSRMGLAGYEALARFPGGSPNEKANEKARGTHAWFTLAHTLGLGEQLEAIALRRALESRQLRPAGTTLAVNLSPAVLTSSAVNDALPDDLSGIEIELTEHEWIPGNSPLRRELDRLRERGARVAIDDVGVAHSGLRRVMELAPDRIKLDRHLVQGVSTNAAKTALIKSVVDFAEQVRCDVCAEGVESLNDLEALAELDVGYAQGWAIGMPDPGFLDVDAAAASASQDSLRGLLTSPVPSTFQFDAAVGVEHLLSRLASVTSLSQLARLAAEYAGVLGADLLVISVLTADSALRSLESPFGLALGDPCHLTDYPVTRQALEHRTIVPVYLPGGAVLRESDPGESWLGGGDQAEWEVLRSLDMETALLVPVVSRDVPVGLLECYGETSTRWSRRQIRSARTVAAMLGPVLDLLLTRG